MKCPCGSSLLYNECCELYHLGKKLPISALDLMRSRYSAYVIPNGKYLLSTTYPSERHHYDQLEMEKWGRDNKWTELRIVKVLLPNFVEFEAHYINSKKKKKIHHERSMFKQLDGKWYYFCAL